MFFLQLKKAVTLILLKHQTQATHMKTMPVSCQLSRMCELVGESNTLDPVGLGPVGLGPVDLGLIGLGPVDLGPVGLGPVGLSPVGLGPVVLRPVGALRSIFVACTVAIFYIYTCLDFFYNQAYHELTG